MISGQEIEKIFRDNAERIFLINAETHTSWTYKQFHDLVAKMAQGLTARGLQKGERFAVLLPNSAELASLYFASLLLGTIIMPINPRLHPREIESILDFSTPKMALYAPSTQNLLTPRALARVPMHLALEHCAVSQPDIEISQLYQQINPCDVFLVTFTSGTTGHPKGVAHRISSVFENARLFNERINFTSSDCFLHVMPMAYMAGILNTLVCPFLAQGTIVSIPPFDARTVLFFWNSVIQYKANAMWLAPTMLAALLKMDRDSGAQEYCRVHMKAILVGTAPLPISLKNDFDTHHANMQLALKTHKGNKGNFPETMTS
ncbi:MAG: class I adenylate-forming enzyme family protein, partial [Candidatus Omnitrophota bacterium]